MLLGAFQALSEPLRLETVELLRDRELCVGELCDALAVAQSKISFHLKVLRQAELILGRQEGRWVYYRLNVPQFARVEQYLAELRCFSPMVPSGSRDGGDP
ncbi:MAG: metalloregulator ArsR/SmtB family transcription factor [Cyanophyceae cyanobacterium]